MSTELTIVKVDAADAAKAIETIYNVKLQAFARYALRMGAGQLRIATSTFDVLERTYHSESVQAIYHPDHVLLTSYISVGACTNGSPRRGRLDHRTADRFGRDTEKLRTMADVRIAADIAGISSRLRDPAVDRERYGHLPNYTED